MVLHRGAMLKRIYDWCIDAAHKPYALWIMGAVAFAESSFFPGPAGRDADPDVAGAPAARLALCRGLHRDLGGWAACSATPSARCCIDSVGHWLIQVYGLGDKVDAFRASYAEWGAVIILLKGLTPIPYKLVTITSGFAGYNIGLFILCSIVARGGRFFIVAILLNRYGDWIRLRIEKHLGLWVALGAAVLVLGFVCRDQIDLDASSNRALPPRRVRLRLPS